MALQRLVVTVLMVGVLLAAWTLLAADRREDLCEHGSQQASATADLFGAATRRHSLEGC